MPVYKSKTPTKDKRTWFYKITYKDSFGNTKQKVSKKYLTKLEAKSAEMDFISNLKLDHDSNDDMTFKELFNKYLDFKEDKVRRSTFESYSSNYPHIECFMNIMCKNYNIKMFEDWKKHLNENTNLSFATKVGLLKFWKAILNFGITWYGLNFLPVYRKMTNFSDPNGLKKEMDFYTYDEFKLFLEKEDNNHDRCMWQTFYYCGLRIGELRGLTWDSINFDNKTISITKQIRDYRDGKRHATSFYLSMPKTKNSYRTIPICDKLLNDLQKLYSEISKYKNFHKSFFVFSKDGGLTPISESYIRDNKNKICNLAGLRAIRIHDFRHSCASLLINKGANITIVAEFLGHTKIEETLNTYSHMYQSALKEVINIMNKLT